MSHVRRGEERRGEEEKEERNTPCAIITSHLSLALLSVRITARQQCMFGDIRCYGIVVYNNSLKSKVYNNVMTFYTSFE